MEKIRITLSGTLNNGMKFQDAAASLLKAKIYSDVPKTYKYLGILSHNIGNLYNSSILRVYSNRRKELIYEIYRDGCFFAYYGKLILD